ncbi:TetR/AcrR family transcriptional regulator [Smaragdicoccus niigatensis]|uniref:TetR/AcrR family transcriptional regulator n=1 Tax=Smaragdicoccus niigatensis TaxID=359359 RepID=UPI00035E0D19|nr:TetR family transcriptional regulator [Smaragdicoccus niigatensis]
MTTPDSPRYQDAAKTLMRNTILDALGQLVAEREWTRITLTDVAKLAGVSRQTVYAQFKSRSGLAMAYVLRFMSEVIADGVEKAITDHPGDPFNAFVDGFRSFFQSFDSDPVVKVLLHPERNPDLIPSITDSSTEWLGQAKERLSLSYQNSWAGATAQQADVLASAVVRVTFSYVLLPPENDRDHAVDLAAIFAPCVYALLAMQQANNS